MDGSPRDPARGIKRLYLDFDSFFATAEQHFNPDLRGRPVGVVPLDAPNTGCIAVSREAKALGVGSSMSLADARAIAPDMVFVVARHDVYVRLHNRIVAVIEGCLPVAAVRSIDEVVCHLTGSEAREGEGLARRIKAALAAEFSSGLTCSIGMGPTELLAKIAAELHKPDGLVILDGDTAPGRLADLPLTKIPGISKGMERRLQAAGVTGFADLWALAPKQTRAIWGSVEGERFWNGLHGLPSQRSQTTKRMFGHSRMLPHDWRSPDRVAICARQLCAGAARRLRRSDYHATRISVGLRGGGYRSRTGSKSDTLRWRWETQILPARDDRTLTLALARGLAASRAEVSFRPRSVSVMLHGLVEDGAVMDDLFAEEIRPELDVPTQRRWDKVSDVLDRLRDIHGPNAITLGPQMEVPGGYLGAKIAFGRIPDAADFSAAPVADTATHFCTF